MYFSKKINKVALFSVIFSWKICIRVQKILEDTHASQSQLKMWNIIMDILKKYIFKNFCILILMILT